MTNLEQNGHTTVDARSSSDKNVTKERGYWNSFYSKWSIDIPSQFCVLTATEAGQERPIVEFGCGNGRDSIYLSTQGFRVYATDLSQEAITKNKEKISESDRLSFSVCDCTDSAQVGLLINKARKSVDGGNITVYTRFFLHSIDDNQEKQFFEALALGLVPGDRLYMEFRCAEDEDLDKVHGKGHYRRYINTPDLVSFIKGLGFDTLYERTGQGMAKFKSEDPFVSRIISLRR